MVNIETLTKEINALNFISKDMSFDKTILDDAIYLIQYKNKQISEMGGEPIVFEVKESVGISNEESIRIIIKKMGVLKRFTSSPIAQKKYNLLDKMLKMKTGVNYQEYLDKGEKFFVGGSISGDSRMIVNNLAKTNEFVIVNETKNDAVLRYTTPEGSILFQVLTPNANVVFALGNFVKDNFNLDFYSDEVLNKSLNLSYSFTKTYNPVDFKIQYINLRKKLKELDKKLDN